MTTSNENTLFTVKCPHLVTMRYGDDAGIEMYYSSSIE